MKDPDHIDHVVDVVDDPVPRGRRCVDETRGEVHPDDPAGHGDPPQLVVGQVAVVRTFGPRR